jgi:hypothetical protein
VLAPNDFSGLADIANRLLAFQDLYSAAARPFNWKYTTTDLHALLDRIAAHQQHTLTAAAA